MCVCVCELITLPFTDELQNNISLPNTQGLRFLTYKVCNTL